MTPVLRLVDEVCSNPVFFDFVGMNCHGMMTTTPVAPEVLEKFHHEWDDLGRTVARTVKHWSEDYGIHKQTINRALEPWLRIRTLVTATEMDNFYRLRLATNAQPEMQHLAQAMLVSANRAKVGESKYHIPYRDHIEPNSEPELMIRSIAACARVSVLRGDEKKTTYEEDAAFVRRLLASGHMSPFEHVATYIADGEPFYNLVGWASMRYLLENPSVMADDD